MLTPTSALASPAHDEQPGATGSATETQTIGLADDYEDPDDADEPGYPGYGDSDLRLGDSADPGGEYPADEGSGHRAHTAGSHPAQSTAASAPRATRTAERHPVRAVDRRAATGPTGRATHTRPMSSGERQYRNGCRQGYIVEDCGQYDVPHLLQRGINPYL